MVLLLLFKEFLYEILRNKESGKYLYKGRSCSGKELGISLEDQ